MNSSALMKLVDQRISRSISTTDMGTEGALYVSCVTNPFGSEESAGMPVCTRIPNGSHDATGLVVSHGRGVIPAGTCTSCIIELVGHAIAGDTVDQCAQVLYNSNGDNMGDYSKSPNAVIEYFDDAVQKSSYIFPVGTDARVVSAGLRISPVSSVDTSATYQAYVGASMGRSAAATWATCQFLGTAVGPEYQSTTGITTRRPLTSDFETWCTSPSYIYTGTGSGGAGRNNWGVMPRILCMGIDAGLVINFEWRIVYEVKPTQGSPTYYHPGGFEPELNSIVKTINDMPLTATGNSFTSFLKNAWTKIKSTGRWVLKNKDQIEGVYNGIKALAV